MTPGGGGDGAGQDGRVRRFGRVGDGRDRGGGEGAGPGTALRSTPDRCAPISR